MELGFWEIAKVTEAVNDWHAFPDFKIATVEFDSRKITKNSFFVPLQGARDGHDFVARAKENGAGGSFWQKNQPNIPKDFPVLVVSDPLTAMQKIAHYFLKKNQVRVVAITGSNGKTTTKDMVEAVLSPRYRTYKTQGNYNNHIGVPYTLLHMPATTEIVVLEMGMDHKGEIEKLSKIGQPDIAAITMIGESHIEHLGSRKGIAEAKMEIIAGMKPNGTLIIPESEELLRPLTQTISQTIKTFGTDSKSDLYTTNVREEKEKTIFEVNGYPKQNFSIPVLGKYNTQNALIALLVGQYFHVEPAKMMRGLATMTLTQNRTQWLTALNGAEVLSDVYNANPTAMSLVLDSFSKLLCHGKKIVVLGDMLDLGEKSAAMHCGIAEHIRPDQVQEVFLLGEQMKHLAEELKTRYPYLPVYSFQKDEQEKLVQAIQNSLKPADMILLKASNGMHLNQVVKKIVKF